MNAGEMGRNGGERQQKLHCQGAEKITFTADYSGKLKLAFTSPDVISTSTKSFLTTEELISQFICLLKFLKKTSLASRAS